MGVAGGGWRSYLSSFVFFLIPWCFLAFVYPFSFVACYTMLPLSPLGANVVYSFL